MSDEPERPSEEREVGGDTEMFRAFVEREESRAPGGATAFRLLTLAAGLAVFALIVVLLLR